jgi:hypothetical protein
VRGQRLAAGQGASYTHHSVMAAWQLKGHCLEACQTSSRHLKLGWISEPSWGAEAAARWLRHLWCGLAG